MPERIFGAIPGIMEGALFATRDALSKAGVHRPNQAGISGSQEEGADSIVVSGGYEDDEDLGDVIIYTGEGGRDPDSGKQIADQELTGRNKALAKDSITGLPVRVVRKVAEGYRYDGLFNVENYKVKIGKSGKKVYQYRIVKFIPASDLEATKSEQGQSLPPGSEKPSKKSVVIQRIIRDTAVGMSLKALYDYKCQICGTILNTPVGLYAESAHIKPLGKPHNGPDTPENILCLCPNHHVLFDSKAFAINDNLSLIGLSGTLYVRPEHKISKDMLKYHREQYFH